MFAVDTMLPINTLFVFFVLLCLYACIVGLTQTPQSDRAEGEMPVAFRDMPGLSDVPASADGHSANGARHRRLNGNGKDRGK